MKATKKRLKKVLILLFVIAIITVLILESKTITSTIAGMIPEEMVSNQSVDEVSPAPQELKATVELETDNIDNILPTGTVEYSVEELTNQSVKATLTPSEEIKTPDDWTKVNESEYTKIYDENVNENIEIEDLAGNKGSVQITIINIDKDVPTAIIEYDTKFPTNGNVVATLIPSEDILTPDGWTKIDEIHYEKVYENNVNEIITLRDIAGNLGSIEVKITIIDKTAPIGEVEYSTISPTNENVLVTMTTNKEIVTPEDWTKINETTYTKIYEENINEILFIKDTAGNMGSVNIKITNVDKTTPTGTVVYSTEELTNENVKAIIETSEEVITPEDWTQVDTTHYEKIYKENIIETITLKDAAGNIGSIEITISNIDKTVPTATVEYSIEEATDTDVIVTLIISEEIKTPDGWKKVNKTEYTKVFDNNIAEIVELEDMAGNKGTISVIVNNIDRGQPTGIIIYNTTLPTNGDVLVTMLTNKEILTPSGWTKIDAKHYEKEYDDNVNEDVELEDLAGNKGKVNITINNIDKGMLTGTVVYTPSTPTNGNVTATITTNKEIKTPDGWTEVDGKHFTKSYEENTKETVLLENIEEETSAVNVEVTNIDRVAPTGEVSYDVTKLTNGNVTVTIETSEEIVTPEDWTKVDETHYTKTYTENTEETIEIEDLAGNKESIQITIENIDREVPIGEVNYDITELTDKDVVVTIETNKEIITPEGWTKVDETHYTKTYTENTEETIEIEDLAGNKESIDIVIENIDKTLLIGKASYSTTELTNGNVTTTIETNREIITPDGWTKTDETHYTKVYTENIKEIVKIKDSEGITSNVEVEITNIDKEKPTAKVTYKEYETYVIATIETNKEIKTPDGWIQENKTKYTKVYKENKEEKIEIEDLAGNKNEVLISITQIKGDSSKRVLEYNNYIVEGLGDIIFDSTYALKVEKKILSQYEIAEHNKRIGNVISGNGLIEVFEITITKNGIVVSEFKDGIKIKIPRGNYSKYSEIKVVHVGTNGVYTQMPTTMSNDYVEFTTTHLSEYAVTGRTTSNSSSNINNGTNNITTSNNNKVYDQTSTGSKTDDSYYNPKTGDINLIVIIVSSFVAITVIAVCIKKKNYLLK